MDPSKDDKTPAGDDKKKAEPTTPKPPAPTGGPKKQESFDADYVQKLRDESAKFRVAAKENEEKAKQFDDQAEARKSELQKATERATRAEKEAATERIARTRIEVAQEKKLPAALVSRLRGDTVEEMRADAEALSADLGASYVAKGGVPPSASGAGVAGGGTDYESMSPAELVKLSRDSHT